MHKSVVHQANIHLPHHRFQIKASQTPAGVYPALVAYEGGFATRIENGNV